MEKMKTLLMSICLLLVSAVSFAQVEEASGNVTDNSGEPVIGATVTVVGGQGNAGTVTDIDGNFTVQVQSGSKLSISFMGYKTQVVKAAKGLRIVLEEDALVFPMLEILRCVEGDDAARLLAARRDQHPVLAVILIVEHIRITERIVVDIRLAAVERILGDLLPAHEVAADRVHDRLLRHAAPVETRVERMV